MKTASASHDEIRELTAAEIHRQIAVYEDRRREVTTELASIFKARMEGTAPAPAPLTDRAKSARARAKEMLGDGVHIALPPTSSREDELEIERDAIVMVIEALSRGELAAQVSESVAFAEDHRAEWREACHDALLAAIRLRDAEARAAAIIDRLLPGTARLPLTEFIGRGRVGDLLFSDDVLDRATKAAVADGIITKSETKGITNG